MSEEKDWVIGNGIDTEFEKVVKNESAGLRYWMPKGSEKRIVFLTEEPKIIYYEHQIKIGDSYRNFATCMAMSGKPCPLCDMDVQKYQAAAFTIIDTSKFQDKEGKEKKNTKRLFIAKNNTWEKLVRQYRRRKEAGEKLRGAAYLVARGKDDKSPSVGEDFEFIGMVDLSKYPDTEEFNYREILKPNPEMILEYCRKLERNKAMSSKEETTGLPKPVPF